MVASAEPGIVTTPDGWMLTVVAKDETQLPVAPLTTAVSSREYLVGGTFTGTVTGSGKTSLTGGIARGRLPDRLRHRTRPGQAHRPGRHRHLGFVDHRRHRSDGRHASRSPGTIEIHAKPGTVSTVTVDKKEFKAAPVRVTLKDTHIKVDGCVGQSFLRSYATLTSSTTDTDDVVAYYGVTKAV